MAETLTESFCERCGTRYEFKAPTRLNPLRKTRGLIGGLRNYVMSQDALGDAVGDAMRSEEERLASAQLEAFHESFNFCIDCRQYTCLNCWNDDAGRCRSCAPIPGTDDLADRLAASMAGPGAVAEPLAGEPAASFGAAVIGPESWPSSDLPEVAAGNGGCEAVGQVIGARDRGAAATAAGVVVPAVEAGVLATVDAEVERLVECLELGRRQPLLLGAHRVADGVAERVLAHDVVLEAADQPPRLAQRVQAGRRLELVARPAAFAE